MAGWREVQQSGDRPGPRSSHSLAATGQGKIVLFGGELEPRCPVPNDTYELTLASGKWRKLEATGDVPSPRIAPTMAKLGNAVYLFGTQGATTLGCIFIRWLISSNVGDWRLSCSFCVVIIH